MPRRHRWQGFSARTTMYPTTHYRLMAEYNRWMNRKLFEVCAGIPDAERRRDMGAFFRSVHGTLNHLLYGDIAWMARFNGETPDVAIGRELYADFDELRAARERMDRRILAWSRGLDTGWLESPFEYTSSVDGKTRVLPAWILVDHLFNHQTHHRGQLTTLLMQLGYDPGVTDIPWLPALQDGG